MQDKYLLSVLITNYNTLDFIKLSLFALKKLTKNKYKVLINDNGSRKKEVDELKRIGDTNKNIFVNFRRAQHAHASYAHAEALDILIDMADTEYTVVLDSDCIFLLKNWDEALINGLNEKIKIIGTPLPQGRSGLKPYDFPFQFAVLFETKIYKELEISCMPKDILKGQDTCWEWMPKFVNNGYLGRIFTVENTRDFKDGPFNKIICEEYYIDNGKLIVSHFGRGSSGGIVKYYHKWYFNMPIISRAIRKYAASKQKKRWMDICYNLIVDQ
ncbi:MAG: glycosyltransferase [Candidatus Omnitrophica bacterium]|nr:glycosyltransferase [Candidatus Omnitrophota bacterium]